MRPAPFSVSESLPSEHKGDRQFVTALARGFDVLRCFNETRSKLKVAEIARITGLPQPTVWRLCNTLVKCGLLCPDKGSDRLCVGLQVLGLGHAALSATGFDNLIREEMHRIAMKFHLAVSLAIRDQLDMVIIQRARGDGSLLINLHLGSRLPIATSTFGVCFLGELAQNDRQALFDTFSSIYGDDWPGMEQRILDLLAEYPAQGFIGSYSSLYPDINSVAVPVHSRETGQFMVLNCGGPANTITRMQMEEEVVPELKALASTIRAVSAVGHADDMPALLG